MSKTRKYLAILALALAGGSIYLLPYLKYIFYDQMISVMEISNTQIATMVSIYSVGCMILYIPGGILADKLSTKKSLIVSLIATAILTILYGVTMNYTLSLVIWFLLSMTTAFIFWTSLMKAVGQIGTEEEQGRMYGIYYAGNGLTQAICNAIALAVFSKFSDPAIGLKMAVLVMAAANIAAAAMVYFFVTDTNQEATDTSSESSFDFSKAKEVLKNPTVWLLSLTILCSYSIFTTSTYFTPYLTEVVGISEEMSSIIAIIRGNLFLVVCAPLGGYIVDKLRSTTKWFIIGNTLTAIFFILVVLIPSSSSQITIVLTTLMPCALGIMVYGVAFSMVGECKFPTAVTATVIGIASIIGYLPDFYMHNLCGLLLDNMGAAGYTYIFVMLAGISLLGAFLAYVIKKRVSKEEKLDIMS
ncbi:MAG: MFS transporter [Terrisporobacter sp.]|uniref:MFS transporter n=1 Tax=Terrisporobacter sp. TaxID=1965305 RepID=UPI002FC6D756